ncbi:MAG: M28 family metallopeptidase [Acidobacteriota bacterium]|nr:M28 family metallopeptidase [Acidobacteriota bacterium]
MNETLDLFGSKGLAVEISEYQEVSNVVAEISGKTQETLIVGAHYDKTDAGCGVIDNWTGVVMLSHLAKELRNRNTEKSYTFVAFGGEERDLQGSKAMAEAIANGAREKPCAMINLDSFGFEKTWALRSISDPSMLDLAADVERGRGGSFSIRNYRGASSDSKSFRRIGVPSITFSGLGDDWRDYIHGEEDVISNIDFDAVAENYDFLREFVLHLDTVPCRSLVGGESD